MKSDKTKRYIKIVLVGIYVVLILLQTKGSSMGKYQIQQKIQIELQQSSISS